MVERNKDDVEHELELIKNDGWLGTSAARIVGHHGSLLELEVQRYVTTGHFSFRSLCPL